MTCAQPFFLETPPAHPLIHTRPAAEASCQQWYAVQTRSNFEKRTTHELHCRGVDAFLPALTELRQWKGRKKTIEMPLFKGYLFVRLTENLDARWTVLKSAGVVRILGRGSDAEPVPEFEIEAIRQMLHAGVPLTPHHYLREGVRVRVRHGALKGVEGIYLRSRNSARLVISIDLLSQSVFTEIDADNAEVVREPSGTR